MTDARVRQPDVSRRTRTALKHPILDPAGPSRGCRDPGEPGPRAGRLREAGTARRGRPPTTSAATCSAHGPPPRRPSPKWRASRSDSHCGSPRSRRSAASRAFTSRFFVRPDYRGRGIGKALLAAVARLAVEQGCGRLEWSVLELERRRDRLLPCSGRDRWTSGRSIGSMTRHPERLAATATQS